MDTILAPSLARALRSFRPPGAHPRAQRPLAALTAHPNPPYLEPQRARRLLTSSPQTAPKSSGGIVSILCGFVQPAGPRSWQAAPDERSLRRPPRAIRRTHRTRTPCDVRSTPNRKPRLSRGPLRDSLAPVSRNELCKKNPKPRRTPQAQCIATEPTRRYPKKLLSRPRGPHENTQK